jgi:hypothetical protein
LKKADPESLGHVEAPLVRFDRDRNNGDETAQGGEKLVRLVPRHKHLAPCDVC